MAWQIVRFVVSLVLAGYGLYVVYGNRTELSGAASSFDSIRWEWLAAAVVLEAASMMAFAALQRRLLLAGRVKVPFHTMASITMAGNSIQNSLPAGPVFSNMYAFRQLRGRGADDVLSGWVLIGTAAMTMITLVLLAGIGLAGAYGTGSGLNLVTDIVSLLALAAFVVFLWSRRDWIVNHQVAPLRAVQKLLKRPRGDPRELIREFVVRMDSITPSKTDWLMATTYALANWVCDIGCLVAAFLAVGASVPWRALLLAYGAAQLVANLPITPGGLGVVEGSLAIGLVVFGGNKSKIAAAVLIYRLLSFWALLPIGWAAWPWTNMDLRRREEQRVRAGLPEEVPGWQPQGAK